MSSVKAILRIDKINAKGLAPLYLRSTHNRKSAFKALGIYIHPDDWDAVAEKVRKSKRVPNSIRINNLIAAQKLEVQNYLLDVAGGAKPYNPQAVKRAVSRFNHASFTQYAEDYLKSINTAEKYTTYKTYRTLLRNLNEYAGRELYFGDIDVTFLKDYYRYMTVTKGNTNNTALSNLKLIRKLFYDAIREEIVQPDQNPFPKFKFKWDTPDVEYLTEEELERIETLSYPEGSLIGHVRDLYVFVCYAAGIRIGDALRLKWGNVERERLSLTTEKTKSGLNILLPSKAQAILQRYKCRITNRRIMFFRSSAPPIPASSYGKRSNGARPTSTACSKKSPRRPESIKISIFTRAAIPSLCGQSAVRWGFTNCPEF